MKTTACFVLLSVLVFSVQACNPLVNDGRKKYGDAKTKLDKLAKHEAGDDVITDEEELETLKEGKTTSDETVKEYKKLEKELKDLKSAELETKNKIAAVTKQLAQLGG
uniref:Lipoprotein n=1 Tax=Steinernema glaseri TaxID=37863 RepID=A0A1I7YXI0_9BILA